MPYWGVFVLNNMKLYLAVSSSFFGDLPRSSAFPLHDYSCGHSNVAISAVSTVNSMQVNASQSKVLLDLLTQLIKRLIDVTPTSNIDGISLRGAACARKGSAHNT